MLANRRNVRRLKVASDENPVKAGLGIVGVKGLTQVGSSAANPRSALGDLSNNTRKALQSKGGKEKAIDDAAEKPVVVATHRRTVSAAPAATVRQPRASIGARPPVRAGTRSISTVLSSSSKTANGAPVHPLPGRSRVTSAIIPKSNSATNVRAEEMDIEDDEAAEPEMEAPRENIMEDVEEVDEEDENQIDVAIRAVSDEEDIVEDADADDDWTMASPKTNAKYQAAVEAVKASFQEEIDEFDMTMVSEYAEEIFAYMGELELQCMPNPTYMDGQSEIEWAMRKTLVDWLLQVHLRYHMLPETLWIAVNIVDRFLSRRVVSLVKLQLVGVTAMFIASKYEEIMAPSVEEFAFMTENGYTRDEILKGEKIILQTIDFNVSPYCSPYSWVRRISKADDYDIQTRTLCKFLMEVTLLDHRFLRAKPSLTAAVGMYTSKLMLQGKWDDAFVYYSDFTQEQLHPGFLMLVEDLVEPGFEQGFVSKKYANKKFLKASLFARDWAMNYVSQHLQSGLS